MNAPAAAWTAIPRLEQLIEALRNELQQYGEMLARLDLQQDSIMRRAPEDLLQTVSAIDGHGQVMQEARRSRELCQQELVRELGLPASASFQQLIPLLPEDYRPLMNALVQENNALLVRVQQRSRQNHLLLSRTLELMQRFVNSLFPSATPPVYNGAGKTIGQLIPAHALYEAVG